MPRVECGNYVFFGPEESETTYKVTVTVGGYGETALERFLGCVMIGIMPNEGLEEALFSLRDMLEYYSRKPTRPAHLATAAITGTIGDKKKRPNLIIS